MAEFKFTEQELKFLAKKTIKVPSKAYAKCKRIEINFENPDEYAHEFMIIVIPMDAADALPTYGINITIKEGF